MGIGLFVSGAVLVVVATVLVSGEVASILQIAPLAFLGAVLGDHTGFYAGRWLGPRFHRTRLAERYRHRLERAERLARDRGALAIFIGRFIPAVRSMIPALLGMSGFARTRYSVLNLLACLLWAAALGLILSGTSRLF